MKLNTELNGVLQDPDSTFPLGCGIPSPNNHWRFAARSTLRDERGGITIPISRGTSASYFDGAGVLQQVSSNEGRFDYGGNVSPLGLLIEKGGTNLSYPSDGDWTFLGGGFTKTANYAAGLDGTTTATRYVWTTTSGTFSYAGGGLTASVGVEYTSSIYVKPLTTPSTLVLVAGQSNGTSNVSYAYNFSTETGTASSKNGGGNTVVNVRSGAEKLDNGWYRLSVTMTNSLAVGITIGILASVVAPGDIIVDGAQFEKRSYPSSLIPTTTAQVSRNSDDAEMVIYGTDLMEDRATTVLITYSWPNDPNIGDARHLFDRPASELWGVTGRGAVDTTDGFVVAGPAGLTITASPSLAENTEYKTAWAYDEDQNVRTLAAHGQSSTSSSTFSVPTGTTINVGRQNDDTAYLDGHIKEIVLYQELLSVAQLERLIS